VVGRPQELHQPAALGIDLLCSRRCVALLVGGDETILPMRDVDRRLEQVRARESR
jgi:hypothetical protein